MHFACVATRSVVESAHKTTEGVKSCWEQKLHELHWPATCSLADEQQRKLRSFYHLNLARLRNAKLYQLFAINWASRGECVCLSPCVCRVVYSCQPWKQPHLLHFSTFPGFTFTVTAVSKQVSWADGGVSRQALQFRLCLILGKRTNPNQDLAGY